MREEHVPAALVAAIASAALVACSATGGAERETASEAPQSSGQTSAAPAPPAATADAAEVAHTEGATVGGDGSAIHLAPLSRDDMEAANLGGELACSFGTGEGETLLLAKGIVASDEAAFGVVKVGDSIESVSTPGGFDAMIDGASFVGRGKTIEIERTASQPVGGGESPPYPARLTFQRADGASRAFDGLWTCGP